MVATVPDRHPLNPNDPRSRHREAVLAERRRRARLKEERRRAATARAWAEFGVAADRTDDLRGIVSAVVATVPEPGEAAVLRSLLRGEGAEGGPEELLRLLRALPPLTAMAHVADLHRIGAPVAAAIGPQAVSLAAESATLDELVTLESDSAAWRLWRDTTLVRHGAAPVNLADFVRRAPLAAVDDLITNGGTPTAEHWAGRPEAERRYLRARVAPQTLTEEELLALDWDEEVWRRRLADMEAEPPPEDAPELVRLLHRVGAGDVDALVGAAELLPSAQADLIGRVLASPTDVDAWPEEVVRDPAMWPVLDRVWQPEEEVGLTDDHTADFVVWCGLRDGYDMLLALESEAEEVLGPNPRIREEAVNMLVYLRLRFSSADDSETLAWAETRLRNLGRGNPAVEGNLRWIAIRRATPVNDRGPAFNPYIELGVGPGAPTDEWRSAWRRLRKEHRKNTGVLSDINLARDQLRDLEAAGTPDPHRFFQVPLDLGFLRPAPRIPHCLVPDARPLPRRTSPVSDVDIEALRAAAAEELTATL